MALTSPAPPYCGPLADPDQLWLAWNTDPLLLGALFCAALAALWHRRQHAPDASRDRALLLAFGGLFIAFVSPLCAATVALFSARTAHHLLLLGVVTPALAIALPWRSLSAGMSLGLTCGALILWHLPVAYSAAWDSAALYWLLQAALLLPGWLFWSAVLNPAHRADQLLTHALLVAGLAGVMGMIGALLTFAPRALYPQHLIGAEAYGLGILQDQQLAGLIMWVPGFLPIAAVGFLMLRRGWKLGFAS